MLHAQMDRGTLKSARIIHRGEVAHKNTKLITAAFAAGLMESALEQPVNLVNAMALARERGILVEERTAEEPGDFATLIQAEVTTERKKYVAAGTLFGKQFFRLVRLGSYLLDAHIDGTLLVFTHMDRPGLIGFIGRTFGDEGVNIAQMNVGREEQGGEAIGVVNVDSVPSAGALEAVQKHPDILSLSVIKLPPMSALPSWL
jgi:D-3-phosphoglycerate dehydrogenase